ncbi:GTPase HflX [Geomonas sp. Red69]|uniref:GTPase HflX n=1 Tax=Geomonas diazotrophica TaxID=2843197 RepID=A0ABX8JQI6_9BACT|nr:MULTISPECIES: GTPase HflX [Geomonas]MBU5636920.1 GTPase HflX [Geomonas diazotrophica]QWV99697.1 GTPase HflX [Geomonas nitrogeniifigens]QXE88830.1 GTPase HflX [Geomonas nitrogeniifigens]
MKPSQVKRLERLHRRRVKPGEVVSLELARELADISLEIRRQLGVLVSRIGEIAYVVVGDERGIMIPPLEEYPLGKRLLRGVRLVHTHLKGEVLSDDDLTDLSLLRLDLIAALQLTQNPDRFSIQTAALIPPDGGPLPYHVEPSVPFQKYDLDFKGFVETLEQTMERGLKEGKVVASGQERGILISVTQRPMEEAVDSIEELKELARTAGVGVLDTVIQRPKEFNPRYLLGEGKIREVVIKALQYGATMLVFDQELSPAQVRSISELTELKVIDRSQLILDIFARRATTQDGKVQVELAQLKYLMPRLSGRGVQMSRLMGGIGGRGPGETKLEIDRRRIRDRIAHLERELKELSNGRYQRRQKRVKAGIPIISIVGYTNAGKSTLLNTMTKSEVFTEDLLFATLDTSSRRLRFPMDREVIITDTVGFIRSLPKSLMGAFKATLEELKDADLLVHLVDCSNPRVEEQISQVNAILAELELSQKPTLLVFNKMDLLPDLKKGDPLAFMKVRQLTRKYGAITISASDRKSLEPLLKELQQRFWHDVEDYRAPGEHHEEFEE